MILYINGKPAKNIRQRYWSYKEIARSSRTYRTTQRLLKALKK